MTTTIQRTRKAPYITVIKKGAKNSGNMHQTKHNQNPELISHKQIEKHIQGKEKINIY